MFLPTKMTVKLEDDRLVEFDFTQEDHFIVSSSTTLTSEEEALLIFKAGLFIGGGNKALSQFE